MDTKGKVLLSVVAGAVAGATVAILFAPGKGSETREKLMKLGRRKKDLHPESSQGTATAKVPSTEKVPTVQEDLINKGKSDSLGEENLNVW